MINQTQNNSKFILFSLINSNITIENSVFHENILNNTIIIDSSNSSINLTNISFISNIFNGFNGLIQYDKSLIVNICYFIENTINTFIFAANPLQDVNDIIIIYIEKMHLFKNSLKIDSFLTISQYFNQITMDNITLIENNHLNSFFVIKNVNLLKIKNIYAKNNNFSSIFALENINEIHIKNALFTTNNNYNFSNENSHFSSTIIIVLSHVVYITELELSYSLGYSNIPGIVFIKTTNIFIENSIFKSNFFLKQKISSFYGCSLYLFDCSSMKIFNSYFFNNTAYITNENLGGSVIFSQGPLTTILLKSLIFEQNHANFGSVLIEFYGNSLKFQKCLIFNNSALENMNILILNGLLSYYLMEDCIISDNFVKYLPFYLSTNRNFTYIKFNRVNVYYNAVLYSNGFYFGNEIFNRTAIWENSSFIRNEPNPYYASLIFVYYLYPIFQLLTYFTNNTVLHLYSDVDTSFLIFWCYYKYAIIIIENCVFEDIHSEGQNMEFLQVYGIDKSIQVNIDNCSFSDISIEIFADIDQSIVNIFNSILDHVILLQTSPWLFGITQSSINFQKVVFTQNFASKQLILFGEGDIVNLTEILVFNDFSYAFGIVFNKNLDIFIRNLTIIGLNTADFDREITENECILLVIKSKVNFIERFNVFGNINSRIIIKTQFSNINIKYLNFMENNALFYLVLQDSILMISLVEIKISLVFKSNNFISALNSDIFLEKPSIFSENLSLSADFIKIINTNLTIFEGFFRNLTFSTNSYMISILNSFFIINNTIITGNFPFIEGKLCKLIIFHSFFENISLNNINIFLLYLQNIKFLQILNSSFINISSEITPISLKFSYTVYILIENSTFLNIFSRNSKGGALFLKTIYAIIKQCIFINNQAIRGGAIYYECLITEKNSCNLKLINNEFIRNIALIDGGAYKWQEIPPDEENNSFIGNIAFYNDNYSGYFCKLGFEIIENDGNILFSSFKTNTSDLYIFLNESSNMKISKKINIYALDGYNQIIKENLKEVLILDIFENTLNFNYSDKIKKIVNITQLSLFNIFYKTSNKSSQILGGLLIQQNANYSFEINAIKIIGFPSFLIYLQISSKQLNTSIYLNNYLLNNSMNEFISNQTYFLIFPIKLRNCYIGEIYDQNNRQCELCMTNTFSFNTEDLACNQCPEGSYCPGGSRILVQPNFWRISINTLNIYKCSKSDNCLGGLYSNCSDDYDGVLCGSCKTGFGRNFFGKCENCNNFSFILSSFVFFLVFLAIILYISHVIINAKGMYKQRKIIIFEVIIYYYQMFVSVYSLQINLFSSYTENYINYINEMTKFNFWNILDCLPNFDANSQDFNVFMGKNSIIIVFIYLIYWISYFLMKKLKFKYIIMRVYICYQIIHPTLFYFMVSNIVCQEISGEYYLINHKYVHCFTNEYYIWLIMFYLPNICFLCVFLPIYLIKIIKKPYKIQIFKGKHQKSIKYTNIFNFYKHFCIISINLFINEQTLKIFLISGILLYNMLYRMYYNKIHKDARFEVVLRRIINNMLNIVYTISFALIFFLTFKYDENFDLVIFLILNILQGIFIFICIMIFFKENLFFHRIFEKYVEKRKSGKIHQCNLTVSQKLKLKW